MKPSICQDHHSSSSSNSRKDTGDFRALVPVVLQVPVQYIKPVQTGYPEDSDARLVVRCTWGLAEAEWPVPVH